MGDGDAAEARRSSAFTVKIVPIPAYGTKRVEIEYQEPVTVENLESVLAVPLRPDVYRTQTAAHLTILIELRSAHAIRDFAGLRQELSAARDGAHNEPGESRFFWLQRRIV